MVATHDSTKTVSHNTDGSGKTSAWGAANIANYSIGNKTFIMFGINDAGTANQTAANDKIFAE